MNPKYFTDDIPVKKWDDCLNLYYTFAKSERQWIFRGLPDAGYGLETTLERAANRFGVKLDIQLEGKMIRYFRRQAHLYLEHVPADDDTIQWLALMRHFGSPTRVMDWTYSFFVTLFFAVEEAKNRCAIWAIDMDWLKQKAQAMFDPACLKYGNEDPAFKSGASFDCVFCKEPPTPLVYSLNPERLNERLIVQQGLFLAPADIGSTFEANLEAVCFTDDENAKNYICRIIIYDDFKLRREILSHLQRMNINTASLFPGLGGFARSLTTCLANSDVWLR
jgi:FRG domain